VDTAGGWWLREDFEGAVGNPVIDLGVTPDGTPTLSMSTWWDAPVSLSLEQFVRALDPGRDPDERLAFRPVASVPTEARGVMVACMHEPASQLGRDVDVTWDPLVSDVDTVWPLPAGYRYVSEGEQDARPTLEFPGRVMVLADLPRDPGRSTHFVATAWAARLADRPADLFLAQPLRHGVGHVEVPAFARPATAREIADWVRAHGWQPGQALQLAWLDTTTAPVEGDGADGDLARAVASELGTSVYIPDDRSMVTESRLSIRDVVAVELDDQNRLSARGTWQRFADRGQRRDRAGASADEPARRRRCRGV
jgi:hypothetical protein